MTEADVLPTPSKRILIAEDEPSMARALQRTFKLAGFETAIASDGFWTGSLLYTFRPDLITLDLRMPHINGFDVLRFLRQLSLPFSYKVLVISAEAPSGLHHALTLGAHAVVPKPFENVQLLETIHHLLGSQPN